MAARRVTVFACLALLPAQSQVIADEPGEARAIVDRAIEAAGGRAALARYKKPFVRVAEGTAEGGKGDETFKIKITTQLPDKLRTDQTSNNGRTFQIVFNGKKGWNKSAGPMPPGARVGGNSSAKKCKRLGFVEHVTAIRTVAGHAVAPRR